MMNASVSHVCSYQCYSGRVKLKAVPRSAIGRECAWKANISHSESVSGKTQSAVIALGAILNRLFVLIGHVWRM